MIPLQNKVFLVDICGTLFKSNTTMDFMRFHFSNTKWLKFINKILKIRLICFINSRIYKYLNIDIIRAYCIRQLRGYSRDDLARMTTIYYDEYLSKVKNDTVIDLIYQKKEKGLKLVLVSATLDCIAFEISKRLNIPTMLSSKLAYKKDSCCGTLEEDLLGKKLFYLCKYGYIKPYSCVITDNYSDLDIIKECESAYLVHYKGAKNRWQSLLDLKNSKYHILTLDK